MPTPMTRLPQLRSSSRVWLTCAAAAVALGAASLSTVVAQTRSAHTVKILHVFDSAKDGYVVSGVTLAPDGNLYGVTGNGGPTGGGALFRVTPGGGYATIAGLPDSVGNNSEAGLTVGPDGLLYGTTPFTITNSSGGTVFKVTLAGMFTPLFAAASNTSFFSARVTFDTRGTLFGVTRDFGAGNSTAYKLVASGHKTVLVTFNPKSYFGLLPNALALGPDGNFTERRSM